MFYGLFIINNSKTPLHHSSTNSFVNFHIIQEVFIVAQAKEDYALSLHHIQSSMKHKNQKGEGNCG